MTVKSVTVKGKFQSPLKDYTYIFNRKSNG